MGLKEISDTKEISLKFCIFDKNLTHIKLKSNKQLQLIKSYNTPQDNEENFTDYNRMLAFGCSKDKETTNPGTKTIKKEKIGGFMTLGMLAKEIYEMFFTSCSYVF